MKTVPLNGSPNFEDGRGCRGRNGWFRPVKAQVYRLGRGGGDGLGEYISVDVSSKGVGELAPIVIALAIEDALALARAVQEEALGKEGMELNKEGAEP